MARKTAADKVRAKTFPTGLRGYERVAVDAWREEVANQIEALEVPAPRDTAVKRALEEVGEETAAILQRAHEAADELTTRSRSQAEGRLQRAESEAEETVREAQERARQLEVDTRALWEQRARLLEDMRQLADEVLGVADDAGERVDPPTETGPSGQTTDEVPISDTNAEDSGPSGSGPSPWEEQTAVEADTPNKPAG